MAPAGSPFSPFCVYLFSCLSETRGATPRRRDDTAVISRHNWVRHSRKFPHGVGLHRRRMENKRANARTVFVLLRSRSSFLFNASLLRARIKTKLRSADVWRLPSHGVPEARTRKQRQYHMEQPGKKKDEESTGAKEADKKIEGGG